MLALFFFNLGKLNILILPEGKFDIIESKISLVVLIFFSFEFLLCGNCYNVPLPILTFPLTEVSSLQYNENSS